MRKKKSNLPTASGKQTGCSLEAVVVGIPHPKWLERPLALIRTKDNKTIPGEQLEHLLYEHFAKWKFPDQILIVSEIPKTSVGKFNKKDIVKQYENLYLGSESEEIASS
ncbi:AMP-binding enzyme [Brevibacillus sp. FIR094]|uniref:AMP-binding enzyme n=1 Tax=Brevibacillus sp. FIR094 TaxID=3134809 RepID=UPI003D1965AC